MQGLWDGAYGLSSLSEKTRKSNRLQMSLKKAVLSPQLFKETKCGSGRDLNQRPAARQTGAYPTELTGRRSAKFKPRIKLNHNMYIPC